MKFQYKNYDIEIEPGLTSFHVLIIKDGKLVADGSGGYSIEEAQKKAMTFINKIEEQP